MLLGFPMMGFGVVVKRGDTLWHLCKKHLGNPFLWPKVGEYNKLKNPHLIFPGQRIEFPGKEEVKKGIEIEDAEVIELSGYVSTRKKKLESGDKIRTDEAIRTEENSRIELLTAKQDLIQVMEETNIKLEGRERKNGILSIGIIKGRLIIKKPAKKIRVITRNSTIDIEQGEILVDCSELTRVSVFEGEAYVNAYGKRILVSAGCGTIITEKSLLDPIKLPEPPRIILPEDNSVTGNMRPTIKWSASDAKNCLIEIASDISFIRILRCARESEAVSFPLREGNYYLRISGIDNNGIQGKPSEINRFAVERRIGLKYEIAPLFSNLPTRLYTRDGKNYISSNSLIYLLPLEEDNSISKVLVRIDNSPYFSYTEPIKLKEGVRTLCYRPVDMLKEEGEEVRLSFIVDKNPPAGELKSSYPIKNGYLTKDATCTITGSDDVSGLSRVQVMVNNETKEYLERAEFGVSSEGHYEIIYRFEDNVGNLSKENTLSFILDKTPPQISLSSEPKTAVYNENHFLPEENKIILEASDSPAGVSEILYSVDEETLSPYTTPFTIKEEGLHIIRYKAIDKAGNETPIFSNSIWIEPLMYEKYK